MKKLKEPCLKHKIAIPEFTTPELLGMQLHGVCFEKCEVCGWYYSTNSIDCNDSSTEFRYDSEERFAQKED